MTLKKSSRNPFTSLFWSSVRRTCFVPIVTLAIFLVQTLLTAILVHLSDAYFASTATEENDSGNSFGFFWDFISTGSIPTLLLIFGGFLAAIVLFFFAQSKKRCNVIFSVGLSRRKIFLAKYLGGILPFAAALIFSALIELLLNLVYVHFLGLPTVHFALLTVTTMIAVYTLAFTVTAAVTAFSGNMVESLIFTGIIGVFPNLFGIFFEVMRGAFTNGGTYVYEGYWNFFNPFASLIRVINEFVKENVIERYYIDGLYNGNVTLDIYSWSGTITALVLTAVVLTICLFAFPKRRNEISGQFGRAKGLNEICGAMVAFYAAIIALLFFVGNSSNNAVLLLSMFLTFAVVYLIFKLIFGYKRKKVLAQSAKRIVAYAAAFAAVGGIFSTGLLGYSSYVPKAEDVQYVEVQMDFTNPYINTNPGVGINRYQYFGYAPMFNYKSFSFDIIEALSHRFYHSEPYAFSMVVDVNEVPQVMELHRSLAKQGKLTPNNKDVCGYNFELEYTLHNGKTVRRYYSSMSLENAIRALGLSEALDINYRAAYSFYDDSVPHDDTDSIFYDRYFIFSKDLKSCKFINNYPEEFKDAIISDIQNQSILDIFFHTPEDELGVIKFSTYDFAMDYLGTDLSEYVTSDGYIRDQETEEVIDTVENRMESLSSKIKEMDVSVSMGSYIVVTKDMKNTVKYLTDNDLMQYFKPTVTADDVKEIKIATRAESVGNKKSEMLPFFAAAYETKEAIQKEIDDEQEFFHYFANNVKSSITDKKVIQTVLDNAQLYGFNGNDDRVVEVSFNDGSIATYAISAEVYSKLNIK